MVCRRSEARQPQRWGGWPGSGIHPGPSVRLSSSSKERERAKSSDCRGDQANGARFSYHSSGQRLSLWHPSKKLEPLIVACFLCAGDLAGLGDAAVNKAPLRLFSLWS